jgi:hypothetical protein
MFFIVLLAAAALTFGLIKIGNPFRPSNKPVMPDRITTSNLDMALRHIQETYGHQEDDDAHDEADGPAPTLVPIPRKRGRPRKTPTQKPSAAPTAAKPAPVAVLAGSLRIPAQIRYDRGHHIGEARNVIILSALGRQGQGGDFNIHSIRCICDRAKGFRAFQLAHITELVDGETGQIVPDVHQWLDQKLAALV